LSFVNWSIKNIGEKCCVRIASSFVNDEAYLCSTNISNFWPCPRISHCSFCPQQAIVSILANKAFASQITLKIMPSNTIYLRTIDIQHLNSMNIILELSSFYLLIEMFDQLEHILLLFAPYFMVNWKIADVNHTQLVQRRRRKKWTIEVMLLRSLSLWFFLRKNQMCSKKKTFLPSYQWMSSKLMINLLTHWNHLSKNKKNMKGKR